MKHEIIKTENYLLIVDEDVTQAKEGYWIYRDDVKQVYCDKNFWWDFKEPYRKIISHLPLNNSPILEGVDLLPPLEGEVEKLAEFFHNTYEKLAPIYGYETRKDTKIFDKNSKNGRLMIAVINELKAKEQYKYTEEDILAAMEVGFDLGKNFDDDNPNVGLGWLIYQKDNFTQSLQQPKMPVGFRSETEISHEGNSTYFIDLMDIPLSDLTPIKIPKTTTNSQGITQWVGEYQY